MSLANVDVRIDKNELKKMMKERGGKMEPPEKKKPMGMGEIILRLVTVLIVIAYYVVLFFGKYMFPADDKIFLSLNVFSEAAVPYKLVRIISLAILTLSISKILRILLIVMAKRSALTKRTGIAVIELLGNLVKYVAVVILIFLVLNAAGVDTTELLAGLGILSLIIGLGVTNLVEDIVAGVFIIAEHLFDVGDIVVVDDFRGTVVSIGIRSTQIEDEGGDILIMRNSAIENLVNMTDRLSYAICDIPVDGEESIERVEQAIEPALEEMKETIPGIEKGPFYLGVSEMDADAMVLTLVAVCQEDSKYGIQRKMNREIKILFERNNIKLGELRDEDD